MKINKFSKTAGFTLIEILVAIGIFAVISVLGVTGLQSVLSGKKQQQIHQLRLSEYQIAYTIIKRDLEQAINRPVIDDNQEIQSAFIGDALKQHRDDPTLGVRLFEFTRAGVINPQGKINRSSLQRVAYFIKADELIRVSLADIDHADLNDGDQMVLLTGLSDLQLSYQDAGNAYQKNWLQAFTKTTAQDNPDYWVDAQLPTTIDIRLETEAFENLHWVFQMPGGRRAA